MNAALPSPRSARNAKRVLGWLMAAALGLPALLLVAWVASNWNDAPAQPRPAALQQPAPRLSDARNGHDALAGVLALPGVDPAETTRADRAQAAAWMAKPLAERQARWLNPPKQQPPQPPTRQAFPTGAPWTCNEQGSSCINAWLAAPEALVRQREALAWGARCDALLDGDFVFEERIEQPLRPASIVAQHLTGANACMRWFQTGAVLAFVAGDGTAMWRDIARADKLNRALLEGSRSLIATLVATRQQHGLLDLAATLALRDAALAERLQPLLQGWPAQAELARRWMVHESNFGAGALGEAFEQCREGDAIDMPSTPPPRWHERLETRVDHWLCRHGIGMQQQRTLRYLDASWLDRLAALDAGGLAALDRFNLVPGEGPFGGLHWRNTFGAQLVDIGTAAQAGSDYVRRQRDVELHHRLVSLVLSMQRQGIEPAARAAWLARQDMSADERDRIALRDAGRTLAARAFAENSPIVGKGGEFRATWPE